MIPKEVHTSKLLSVVVCDSLNGPAGYCDGYGVQCGALKYEDVSVCSGNVSDLVAGGSWSSCVMVRVLLQEILVVFCDTCRKVVIM